MERFLESVFPYLVLLYLFESFYPLRTAQVLLVSHLRRTFRLVEHDCYLSLSPYDTVIVASQLAVFATTTGLYKLRYPGDHQCSFEHAEFTSLADVQSLGAEEKQVMVNGRQWWQAPDKVTARKTAQAIHHLLQTVPDTRAQELHRRLAQSLDLEELRTRYTEARQTVDVLADWSVLLFLQMFGLLPLVLYTAWGQYMWLGWVLAPIGVTYCAIVVQVLRLHRRFYQKPVRMLFGELAGLVFAPLSVMHTHNALLQPVFVTYDALAVAVLLLPPGEGRKWIRQELHRTQRALGQTAELGWTFYWSARLNAIEQLMIQARYTEQAVFAPPALANCDAAAYCPICHAEYRAGFPLCRECQVEVIPFLP